MLLNEKINYYNSFFTDLLTLNNYQIKMDKFMEIDYLEEILASKDLDVEIEVQGLLFLNYVGESQFSSLTSII